MAILEISNCFLKLAQTHKKIEFFKNKFFSEFLLHYIALCSSQFFQNNFSTCFIFFWVNKTEPKFKCIFNDLCIKKFSR